jgi:hypothetical protein
MLLDEVSEADRRLLQAYFLAGSLADLEELLGLVGVSWGGRSRLGEAYKDASERLLDVVNHREFHDSKIVAIYLDGTAVGRRRNLRTVFWAVGLTADGQKVPLGVVEGKGESERIVSELLTGLARRMDLMGVLWVADGGKAITAAIEKLTNGRGVTQRCRVHVARNVAWTNLSRADRVRIGDEVRARLKRAWEQPDPQIARQMLEDVAVYLEGEGCKKAADSLRRSADLTLTTSNLGVTDPAVLAAVATTNAIESIHGVKRLLVRKKSWSPHRDSDRRAQPTADLTDRRRNFIAAVAFGERKWRRVDAPAREFERMSAAVVQMECERLELELGERRIAVRRLVEQDESIDMALDELGRVLKWAKRMEWTVELDHELQHAADPRLASWLQTNGYTAERDEQSSGPAKITRAPSAEAPVEAVSPVTGKPLEEIIRAAVGDELWLAVSLVAIEEAPDLLRVKADELAGIAAIDQARLAELRGLPEAARTWSDEHHLSATWRLLKRGVMRSLARLTGRQPAGQLPSRPELSWRDVVGEDWCRLFGNRAAQRILVEAVYTHGRGSASPPGWTPAPIETLESAEALTELDRLVAAMRDAGKAVAAGREIERRALFEQIGIRGPPEQPDLERPAASAGRDVFGLIDQHRPGLGPRRHRLLRAGEEAWRQTLAMADHNQLRELRDCLRATSWHTLRWAEAMTLVKAEELDQQQPLLRLARNEWTRGGHDAVADHGAHAAQKRWARTQADAARAHGCAIRDQVDQATADHDQAASQPGGLDRFLMESRFPVLESAIERQLRLNAREAAQDEIGSTRSAGVEVAAGVGHG